MEEIKVEYINVGVIKKLNLRGRTTLARKSLMLAELWKKIIFLIQKKDF